jgi:signal transduction histidine kinase/CheY-like chemotaxis protein
MSAVALLAELLFGLVFAGALVQFVRRRDPVSRDVALAFSPFVVVFVASLWRELGGSVPGPVGVASSVLFLLQPLFVLHLASLVRRVSRRVFVGGIVAIIGSTVATVVLGRSVPQAGLAVVAAFVAVEGIAAVHLLVEARRRAGPGGVRLGIAASATGLFAAALVAIGARVIGPAVTDATTAIATGLVLLAALGYIVAFLPPGFVRQIWQADLTIDYGRALLRMSGAPVEDIWGRLVELAAKVSGCPAALIVAMDRPSVLTLTAGFDLAGRAGPFDQADLDALRASSGTGPEQPVATVPTAGRQLAEVTGARFVSSIALDSHEGTTRAVLLILAPYRSLFHESDVALMATLGAQTALVAERRANVATQEALAQRLAATVDALRSASQAKSDFLASMSHELRTPLSAILGFSDLLRHEEPTGGAVLAPLEWVEHIHKGGEHLLTLINDVLDLSKVEAGRLELHPEPIELGPAVTELVNGIRPLAERKRQRLVTVIPSMTVVADRGRLRQILYNLVSNAIKYTPDEGTIEIEASARDGEVLIAVVDDGVGIAPEDQQAVFEEFRQVGGAAERGDGTGLGLALTRRLVEAHGGRIELESAIGLGSRFTVALPASPGVVGARQDAPSAAMPAPKVRGPEVLVIEDDPSALRLLRQYLEPAGYGVVPATNGEVGLGLARQRPPAAIILDVLLPTIDGWEVLRRLKADADPVLRDVPVVIVTVVDDREVGLALGAVDYLVKPVQREGLLACLARHGISPAAGVRTPRVLAVDDEPAALALVRAALEPEGFDVVGAGSGREALARATDGAIDVVVCDLVMPDVDGFEVIAQLKRNPRTSKIPIVVCTAHDLSADDKARLNGKIMGIVTKGNDARDGLREWLSRALPGRPVPGPAPEPNG